MRSEGVIFGLKLVSQHYKSGAIGLQEVAPPALKAGGILVRTHFSVVSSGTEGMKVREGRLSYLGKARARPDQVKKVLATVRQQGLLAAYQKAMNKLDSLTPLGYSLAGKVVAVGEDASEFHVGQHVACAGAGYANHAEVNFVPVNLAVPIPESVATKHAAFATVGAIAIGSVSYLTQGGSRLPKEQLEVFSGGCAARLENFESVALYGDTDLRRVKSSRLDKGQGAQLDAFIEAVERGAPMPIPLECLFDTTLTTLGVAQALGSSQRTEIGELWSRLERPESDLEK